MNTCFGTGARDFKYPTGKFKKLFLQENWNFMKTNGDGHLVKTDGTEAFGLTTVKMLAPETPEPFLGFNVKVDGKDIVHHSMCFACSRKQNQSECSHDENERAFVKQAPIHLINEAITYGYKLLDVFETDLYEMSHFVFQDMMESTEEFQRKLNNDCL